MFRDENEVTSADSFPMSSVLWQDMHLADENMLAGRIPQFVNGVGYENEAVMLYIHG